MNKLLLSLSLVCTMLVANAQPWTEQLPKDKQAEELTLKDYQEAFNNYWAPFNLDMGYYTDKKGEKHKARGWKQFKRWEYYWETQVDAKTGQFPEKTAYQELKSYLRSQPKADKANSGDWINIGVSTSKGGYAGIGRINCIAFHPTNNNMYWVGTPAGGLWVTTDNGNSWKVLTDANSVLGVSDIIIPSDYESSKTIYIATGDRDAYDNRSIGVLKSTDEGATWFQTDLSFTVQQNAITNRLLKDPNNDQVIIAATTKGVYKTTDGGTTWSESIAGHSFIDMEYKPGDFSILYGSTKSGSIYYSDDAGETWERSLQKGRRIELAVTSAADSLVYAVAVGTNDGLYAVYKSDDSGESFSEIYSGNTKNLLGWVSNGSDDGGQGWYDLAIAVSPTDANDLIVGGVNSHRSTDGGVSWTCSNCWTASSRYNTGGHPVVHADKHNLTYRSNGDLFECNDGGVYISTNDGSTWKDITNGITNSQMYKLSVSQQLDNEILTGLQDNGTKQYSEGEWWDVLGGDGMECLIDYTDYKTQYGSLYFGDINRTTDWWNSSTKINPSAAGDGAWVTPFIIDPDDHNTIYAGFADVWKSTNKGTSWSKISSINDSNKLRSMAIAPSDNNVLYVAGENDIYKTTDGGSSWQDISSGLPSNTITYIAVDAYDPDIVWVTLGGYNIYTVYQSIDGGSTWDNISLGLPSIPVNTIVQDKNFKNIHSLYVGTEAGVFHKIGDNEWTYYSTGLPNVKIGEIEIYYNEDITKSRLRAASYGRGLWETPLVILNVAELDTLIVESITGNNAVASVVIIDGGEDILESGFVYSSFSGLEIGDKYINKVSTNPVVIDGKYTLTLDNLSSGTYYFIKAYLRSAYGYSYSDEISFVTECGGAIAELPVAQEFVADTLPACWDTYDNSSTDMVWVFDNPADITMNSSTSDNGFAIMNSSYYGDGKTQDADLLTTEYDLSNHNYVNLVFEHNAELSDGAVAQVLYSDDNGVNWKVLSEWTNDVGLEGDVNYSVNDLSDMVGGKPGIVFKWNFRGANSGFWAIDDIIIDSLHAVHFNVMDKENNPIKDALVTFNDEELMTGFTGEVLYRSVSNTMSFDYSIEAEGFIVISDAVTLDHENAILDIVLNKIPSNNAYLSDLMIDSVSIDGFSPNDYAYTVMLAWDATEIPIITATPDDEFATVEITQASEGSLLGIVKVTAEDGITERSYRVSFISEAAPTYSVVFNVMNSKSEAVAYATVRLLAKVRSTDDKGVAIFDEISPVGDTVFEITNNSYYDYFGNVSIVDKDVNVDVVMTGVGIELENQLKVDLYPNPANEKLFIDMTADNLPAKITLTNVTGKVVFKKQVSKVNTSIDIKALSKGIYLVNINSGDKSFTKKVVIE